MRLSNRIKQIILNALEESFGDVDIYLFGSRVDDNKKGGDIDIAIKTSLLKAEFRKKKSKFLAILMQIRFDIKIDLVQYNDKNSLLFEEIEKNSIRLRKGNFNDNNANFEKGFKC